MVMLYGVIFSPVLIVGGIVLGVRSRRPAG
jgi:hypothetical protein